MNDLLSGTHRRQPASTASGEADPPVSRNGVHVVWWDGVRADGLSTLGKTVRCRRLGVDLNWPALRRGNVWADLPMGTVTLFFNISGTVLKVPDPQRPG